MGPLNFGPNYLPNSDRRPASAEMKPGRVEPAASRLPLVELEATLDAYEERQNAHAELAAEFHMDIEEVKRVDADIDPLSWDPTSF